jgi:hypothetical protein
LILPTDPESRQQHRLSLYAPKWPTGCNAGLNFVHTEVEGRRYECHKPTRWSGFSAFCRHDGHTGMPIDLDLLAQNQNTGLNDKTRKHHER